jgi:hypothetical protein
MVWALGRQAVEILQRHRNYIWIALETLRVESPMQAHPNGTFDRDATIIPNLKASYLSPSRGLDHDGPESQGNRDHA